MTKHAYYMTQRPFSIGAQWMTMDEAALAIDRGNLCFGFRTSGSTVTIYTD